MSEIDVEDCGVAAALLKEIQGLGNIGRRADNLEAFGLECPHQVEGDQGFIFHKKNAHHRTVTNSLRLGFGRGLCLLGIRAARKVQRGRNRE
jgi:hypothetical protein